MQDPILSPIIIAAAAEAGFTVTAGQAAVVSYAALTALSVGLNYALQASAKQPKPGDGLLSIKQTNPVRQGGYARARCAGSYMLYETDGAGVSYDVLALISGRVCAFRQLYLNDDAPSRTGGLVSGFSDGRYLGNKVNIDWRYGLPTETAYASVVSVLPWLWTNDHRGDGIASMAMVCIEANTLQEQTKYFPNALPNPSFELDLYPIWDPRDPAQDPDDPDTWIAAATWDAATTYAVGARVIHDGSPYYSYGAGNVGYAPDLNPHKWCFVLANPVLQAIDYLTHADHGMGLDRDILITPVMEALKAKADLCDALVLDKRGDLGPRYASGGRFNFDDDPADVIGAILATCDGWMTEDGDGSIVLEVGVYAEPDPGLTLKRQHIVGLSINYGIADEQAVNELALTFTYPRENYKEVPGQSWRNEADISARGLLRSQPLALKWVQRHSQARRLTKRAMARLAAAHGTVTTTLYGLRLLGKRWGRIQYPFLPQVADAVVEFSRGTIDFMAGTVMFEWVVVDPATIDAWDPSTEEGDGPANTASGAPPSFVFHAVGGSGGTSGVNTNSGYLALI